MMSAIQLQQYHTIENLNSCIEESQTQPIILFKHSSICPTSHYAKNQVDDYLRKGNAKIYLLIIQEQRPLSQEIAAALNVKHESPQLLVLKNGEAVSVLNHNSITVDAIQESLQ